MEDLDENKAIQKVGSIEDGLLNGWKKGKLRGQGSMLHSLP